MTREVAEKIVRGITDKIECNIVDIDDWAEFWGFTREDYEEFLDLAIKALEQESCEDTITGIIEYINERGGRNLFKDDSEYDCIIDYIEALPPVQPVGRWIPVSERLPEKGGDYLVTTKWKGSYSGDVYTETNMAVYREKEKEWDCAGIVAWMPLPEPYEPTN